MVLSRKYGGKKSRRKNKNKNKRSNRSRRVNIMKGGSPVVFPVTFSNNDVAVAPQSYLPYNNFANDPGYSVVSSSNTGPFLTGVSSSGGAKRRNIRRKVANKRMNGGAEATTLSNTLNSITNGMGIIPVPHLNEMTGVAGTMSGFSNTGHVFNSNSPNIAPLA